MTRHLPSLSKRQWHFVALLGWLAFAAQAFFFAHFQEVVMDEGAYLYKGWLFIQGIYKPFQPYGPWTNKMPLAFLAYGAVQWLFHPGLDTGRYFSLSCGLLALVGVWVLLRRFTSAKTAAVVMWIAALTVALPRIYSLAATEGLGAALMIWTLVFVLVERPKWWQLFLGGLLAGTLSVTRINLIFVWLFVFFFTWKVHGFRRARWAWLGAVIVPLIVYVAYWPGIFRLWLPWVPKVLRGILPLHKPSTGFGKQSFVPPPANAARRLSAVADVVRTYPLLWLGLIGATSLVWVWRKEGKFYQQVLKATVLLAWALALVHAWVTIGHSSILLFNLSAYMAFFAPVFLFVTGMAWHYRNALLSQRGVKAILLVVAGVIFGSGLLTNKAFLAKVGAGLAKGVGAVIAVIIPWHGVPPSPFQDPLLFEGALTLTFVGAGLAVWGALRFFRLWRQGLISRWMRRSGQVFATALVFLGAFSPTPVFSGSFHPYDCTQGDTLAIHRQIGRKLVSLIPPNAKVYWQGIEAVTPLLYLPSSVQTFPPQYNGHFNYRKGGDTDTLYRWGYWNEALAQQWFREADVVLLSKVAANKPDMQRRLQEEGFVEFGVTVPLQPCRGAGTKIVVYKRRIAP